MNQKSNTKVQPNSDRQDQTRGMEIIGFLLICIAFGLWGCYEDQIGCLDISATNFDVEADIGCPDCCTYPELQIDFQHKVILTSNDTFNLEPIDSTYLDGAGNPFRIASIQYYLSDIYLIQTNGDTLQVADSLTVEDDLGNSIALKDNFLLVNPGEFGVETLGSFRNAGAFDGMGFFFGLNPTANQLDTTYFEDGHPLSAQDQSLYLGSDQGYAFAKIELLLDAANDSLITEVIISGNDARQAIELNTPLNITEGVNPRLLLFVDYLSWFNTINVQTDSRDEMAAKIVSQIADSFKGVVIQDR